MEITNTKENEYLEHPAEIPEHLRCPFPLDFFYTAMTAEKAAQLYEYRDKLLAAGVDLSKWKHKTSALV